MILTVLIFIEMNMMKRIKFLLIILSSMLTLTACSKPDSTEHWIDNPTAKEIKLKIDDKELTIPAKSGINYKIEYGKHTLSYNNDSVNFFVKPLFSKSLKNIVQPKITGFINPTQSNYIFYKIVYIDDSSSVATDKFIEDIQRNTEYKTQVIFDGELQEVEVPFTVTNELFIERDKYPWEFFLGEKVPDIVEQDKVATVKGKIFREDEFYEYMKDDVDFENHISLPSNPKKFNQLSKIVIPAIDLDNINCPEGRADVEKKIATWNHVLTLTGSEFAKEYDDMTSMNNRVATSEISNKCYQDYQNESYTTQVEKITDIYNQNHNLNFFITD